MNNHKQISILVIHLQTLLDVVETKVATMRVGAVISISLKRKVTLKDIHVKIVTLKDLPVKIVFKWKLTMYVKNSNRNSEFATFPHLMGKIMKCIISSQNTVHLPRTLLLLYAKKSGVLFQI